MRHVKRPCDECPWRKGAEPERFSPERWAALAASSPDRRGMGPEFGSPLFACHKSPEEAERACAGWLAQEGVAHPVVRMAVLTGDLPSCSLTPGEDWPELHATFYETMEHDLLGRSS